MQQINLYQDQFKPHREIPWLLIVTATFCLLLVVMAGISWKQKQTIQQAKTSLDRQRAQQQQMAESVELLQQRLSARLPSESLKRDLQLLRAELVQRQPLRVALDQAMTQENTIPQSLDAFAAKPLKQLWFSRILLMDSGITIRLHGFTPHAQNIPILIDDLSSQEVFRQQQFSQLELERQENGLYQFLLSTKRGDSDGAGE